MFMGDRIIVQPAKQPARRERDRDGYGRGRDRDGYGPPRDRDGYGPPRDRDGYGPPRDRDGYGPPRDRDGYGPPRDRDGYGPPRDRFRDERRRGPRRGQYRIIVFNLPPGTSWQDLKDVGREHGHVTFSDINPYRSDEGALEYETREDYECALARIEGTELRGNRLRAEPDGEPAEPSYDRRERSPDPRDRGEPLRDRYRDERPPPPMRGDDEPRDEEPRGDEPPAPEPEPEREQDPEPVSEPAPEVGADAPADA